MTEITTGNLAVVAILALALTCWCWMRGGRSDKWIRRYIGGSVLSLTAIGLLNSMSHYSHWLWLLVPITIASFSMGYGGDYHNEKIERRILFATCNLISGALLVILLGGNAIWLFMVHMMMAYLTVYFAVKNPIHAAAEEVLVCLMLNTCVLMYAFVI